MKDIDKRDVIGCTKLYDACLHESLPRVKRLLATGANPDIPEVNGITPLMEAAAGGNLEMVQLLLGYGADPLRRDKFGDDAITYAEKQGFKKEANHLKLFIKRSRKWKKLPS